MAAAESPARVAAYVGAWRPRDLSALAALLTRQVVARAAPASTERARALLWAMAKLSSFGESVGLELDREVLLVPSLIERCVGAQSAIGPASCRTLRTNLRFLARVGGPAMAPAPAALGRDRSKTPYGESQISSYLALADAQPTVARRARSVALICLGAGAGLIGADLRALRGCDIAVRSGGVVVQVHGVCPRVVPVLARYGERVLDAARFAGTDFIVGGTEPTRRNVTARLVASLAEGVDLPRLECSRLRASWLESVGALIGLPTFMAAAGITCSQRLGDIVGTLPAGDEATAVVLLGAKT